MIRFTSFLAAALLACAVTRLAAADAPSAADARMRDALRNTMLQLRQAQTDLAAAQAAQADSEQKNKTLAAQLEAATKQMASDKDAAEKALNETRSKLEAKSAEAVALRESLEKWKTAQAQAAALAASKESQRAALESKAAGLQQQVTDQQARNLGMYKLGKEILARYERFGLGDALTAREPFVGLTRVKFENLMQDYSDKLADARIKPAEPKSGSSSAAQPPPDQHLQNQTAKDRSPMKKPRSE